MFNRYRRFITRATRALVLFFLLLATACTARPTPLPTPEAAFTLGAPAPTPPPPDEPLLVIGRDWGDQAPQLEAVLEQFSQQHGIDVDYRGDASVSSLLRTSLEQESVPDVILLPNPRGLQELAAARAIPPLSAEATTAVEDYFTPAWIDLVSHNGKIYGVPFDANAKSLLWYNPQALQSIEATPPEGLDELRGIAGALEARGEKSFAVPGGAGWPLVDWFESALLATAGPAAYRDLIDHRLAWTDPRVEEAARLFVELLQPDRVMDGRAGLEDTPLHPDSFYRAMDPETPGAAMWQGQGSIVRSYLAEGRIREARIGVVPFPAGGAIIAVGSVAVGTNTREETAALLTYLAQPGAVASWVQQGGFISPNRALPPERYPTEPARREAELLLEAEQLRYDLSDLLPPNLRNSLTEQMRKMVLNPEQLPEILEEIERVATREQGSPQR